MGLVSGINSIRWTVVLISPRVPSHILEYFFNIRRNRSRSRSGTWLRSRSSTSGGGGSIRCSGFVDAVAESSPDRSSGWSSRACSDGKFLDSPVGAVVDLGNFSSVRSWIPRTSPMVVLLSNTARGCGNSSATTWPFCTRIGYFLKFATSKRNGLSGST